MYATKGTGLQLQGCDSLHRSLLHFVVSGQATWRYSSIRKSLYLHVHFLHTIELANKTTICKEVTILANTEMNAYTKTPVTWDLWHAYMGHPGGKAIKCLPLTATSVSVASSKPQGSANPALLPSFPGSPTFPPHNLPPHICLTLFIHTCMVPFHLYTIWEALLHCLPR